MDGMNVANKGKVFEWVEEYGLTSAVIPNLGERVYVVNVFGKEIYEMEVYAHGKDFFIPYDAYAYKVAYRTIRFDDYATRWFFTLEEAKEYLEPFLDEEEEIGEGGDDWWMAYRM